MNTDLSQSFNKLVNFMFEKIDGHNCERLPDGKFRWGKFIGAREEIEKAISDAGKVIENSLNKKKS